MEHTFDETTIEHWEVSIELARSFLPDDPMNAWERLSEVERQLRETITVTGEASAELRELNAYVASLAAEAQAAAQRWQKQSAEREAAFHMRELTQPTLH
jgi:hypothetical protein